MSKDILRTYPSDEECARQFYETVANEPRGVDVSVIGKSILSKPINLYRIGSGKTNVLYIGAIHGAEYITGSVLFSFINDFLENPLQRYGIDMRVYLNAYTVWVVPVVNPDGVELAARGIFDSPLKKRQLEMVENGDFSRWQANARGVDLNHNFAYGYDEYKKYERAMDICAGRTLYSGEYAESEPESAALANLARALPLSLVVALHSQGEEIYAYPKENRTSKRLARLCAEELKYSVSSPEGSAKYGGFCDYTSGVLGIPSLTFEIGRGENPLPESELSRMVGPLKKALFHMPVWL